MHTCVMMDPIAECFSFLGWRSEQQVALKCSFSCLFLLVYDFVCACACVCDELNRLAIKSTQIKTGRSRNVDIPNPQ